jgi:hypothetical protein
MIILSHRLVKTVEVALSSHSVSLGRRTTGARVKSRKAASKSRVKSDGDD